MNQTALQVRRCWPGSDLDAHTWEQGNTRTSRELSGVAVTGETWTIPSGSYTDWHCTECPAVYALKTGAAPPGEMWGNADDM